MRPGDWSLHGKRLSAPTRILGNICFCIPVHWRKVQCWSFYWHVKIYQWIFSSERWERCTDNCFTASQWSASFNIASAYTRLSVTEFEAEPCSNRRMFWYAVEKARNREKKTVYFEANHFNWYPRLTPGVWLHKTEIIYILETAHNLSAPAGSKDVGKEENVIEHVEISVGSWGAWGSSQRETKRVAHVRGRKRNGFKSSLCTSFLKRNTRASTRWYLCFKTDIPSSENSIMFCVSQLIVDSALQKIYRPCMMLQLHTSEPLFSE